jgi:RNA polymerase sigma-70 factor (ECF subfamily)
MNLSENALLHRARQFDQEALGWIYDEFSSAIYAYAYRLTGNTFLAEECVAETFSRLLQALKAGGGPQSHLKAYLYRTAHNWITDQYRRKAPIEEVWDDEKETISGKELSSQAKLEQNEKIDKLRKAIQALTVDQQLVITLRFLEDLKTDQVAAALGKPSGAVKALQHRALLTLKKVLNIPEKGVPQ